MFPVKREDVCHRLVLQSSRSIEEAFFSVESAGVGYHRLFLTRNIRVSEANMPTSTNMQSSTHLFLLVVVLVMVLKPLPHPGSPPTEDVMQKRGREKKRRRKEFKAKRRPVQDCQKNQHVWTKWHSSGQDVVFFIRLRHVASSAVAWQESAQRRKVKEFGSSATKSWKISWVEEIFVVTVHIQTFTCALIHCRQLGTWILISLSSPGFILVSQSFCICQNFPLLVTTTCFRQHSACSRPPHWVRVTRDEQNVLNQISVILNGREFLFLMESFEWKGVWISCNLQRWYFS